MNPPRVQCPTCRRELDWAASASRPFCSERCRLVDLGAWVSEQRAIAGEPADPGAEETPQARSSPE
ncbi:MAG TPA: DNA gyrase inhibitor YacG [Steroidobacteraceae bacterium]